jgi:hypothetical protein
VDEGVEKLKEELPRSQQPLNPLVEWLLSSGAKGGCGSGPVVGERQLLGRDT